MSAKETGGPAFPSGALRKGRERPHDSGSDWVVTERMDPAQVGMTLRDYFAAKSMQALYITFHVGPDGTTCRPVSQEIGKYAYELADAMLEARKC